MFKRSDFPADFTFGAATAAYQIEGSSFGNAGPSHWDTFSATPGNVLNGDTGAVACDHYNRWPGDLDLVRDGNFDACRFSTSWARVMPEGRGAVNAEGLDFYDRLVDGMLERGIKPALTLYHWDLPQALQAQGGWQNRDIAGWFADYASVLLDRIGDRVWSVSTLNEPWCVAWLSHFLGHHAPGLRDIAAGARAMHNVLAAHGEAMDMMRARGQDNLGIVLNLTQIETADASPEAAAAADREDALFNRWFLQALFHGSYPDAALEGLERWMPAGWQDDLKRISQPMDWMGINYYTRNLVTHAEGHWPNTSSVEGPLPKTEMGWEIYPEGLGILLRRVARDYSGALPLYITENGMAADDVLTGNRVEDTVRVEYLTRHFDAALAAIKDGVPLKGYFVWSLMDNYEWAWGYGKRFGLVHVDYATLERTPKASYHALVEALTRS